jgi:hypothetical protein
VSGVNHLRRSDERPGTVAVPYKLPVPESYEIKSESVSEPGSVFRGQVPAFFNSLGSTLIQVPVSLWLDSISRLGQLEIYCS